MLDFDPATRNFVVQVLQSCGAMAQDLNERIRESDHATALSALPGDAFHDRLGRYLARCVLDFVRYQAVRRPNYQDILAAMQPLFAHQFQARDSDQAISDKDLASLEPFPEYAGTSFRDSNTDAATEVLPSERFAQLLCQELGDCDEKLQAFLQSLAARSSHGLVRYWFLHRDPAALNIDVQVHYQ